MGFVTEWSWNRNDNFQKQSNETNSTLRQRIQNYHHIKTGSVLLRLNFHDTKKGDTLHCLVGRLERDWCTEAAHAITFCKHFQLRLNFSLLCGRTRWMKKKTCCNSFALSKASLFLMKLVKNDSSVG